MTRIPDDQSRRDRWWDQTPPPRATQPNPEPLVTDRLPEKILYGPRGEVIARHDPNPPIGFRRSA